MDQSNLFMTIFHDEKWMRTLFLILGVISIGASLMHLFTGFHVPGLEPIVSAAFWGAFWRWNQIRGKHPGGIWSFMYLLIIVLDLYSGISQIWFALV